MRLAIAGSALLLLACCASTRGALEVTAPDRAVLLGVSESTVVLENGERVQAGQLAPGDDVRASYQRVDGENRALRIEATRRPGERPRPPRLLERAPGDQSGLDDPGAPPRAESKPPPPDPHLTSPNN